MIDRRRFVKLSAGATAAGVLGLDGLARSGSAATAGARAVERIGVQLYTVRSLMEKDFAGTLTAVADIGFDEVEFHDYFGQRHEEVRGLLSELGLDAPAAHFPWQAWRDDPDSVIETAGKVGHRYALLAWLPPEDRVSLAQWKELASLCNRWGEACKSAGLAFAYHNHDFEFAPIDGQVPFEVLLGETDPEFVAFELDLFWTVKGGHDPVAVFGRAPGRFPMCHVKDMGPNQTMVEVGAGDIDFAEIFSHRDEASLRYYFVEHDEPADPLASIRSSYEHLKGLRF